LGAWKRHDRLSVVDSLALAPRRKRAGFYFQVQRRNIVASDVVDYVHQLRRQLRRPLTVVWDRWRVHRKAEELLLARHSDWLRIEYLPAYAPELNPVEGT